MSILGGIIAEPVNMSCGTDNRRTLRFAQTATSACSQTRFRNLNELPPESGWRGSPELWLDAAYEALIESGVEAVKVQLLSKKLRLSRGSFYWMFKDREALLDALLERWREKNTGGIVKQAEAYAVLGLQPGASDEDIRAAHRELMKGLHPDHGGSSYLASKINAARDLLLKP